MLLSIIQITAIVIFQRYTLIFPLMNYLRCRWVIIPDCQSHFYPLGQHSKGRQQLHPNLYYWIMVERRRTVTQKPNDSDISPFVFKYRAGYLIEPKFLIPSNKSLIRTGYSEARRHRLPCNSRLLDLLTTVTIRTTVFLCCRFIFTK